MSRRSWAAVMALAMAPAVQAAEPGTPPVPAAVLALDGCWQGKGEVMGKPVVIALTARRIVQGAMLALDAESSAVADPADGYAAHLLFGGAGGKPGSPAEPVVGFWADSFGGAFAAPGQGETRADGFDVTYRYPDHAFVNRWRIAGGRLSWQIVARDGKGAEKPFASYALSRTDCRPAESAR